MLRRVVSGLIGIQLGLFSSIAALSPVRGEFEARAAAAPQGELRPEASPSSVQDAQLHALIQRAEALFRQGETA